jgi:hypothetical protein
LSSAAILGAAAAATIGQIEEDITAQGLIVVARLHDTSTGIGARAEHRGGTKEGLATQTRSGRYALARLSRVTALRRSCPGPTAQ